MLTALSNLCLERDWTRSLTLFRHLETLLGSEVDHCYQNLWEPAYGPLLCHDGDPSLVEREANWRWFHEFRDWARAQTGETPASLTRRCQQFHTLFVCPDVSTHAQRLELTELLPWDRWLDGPLAALYSEEARALARRNWSRLLQME